MDVHNAARTLRSNWKFIKILLNILMKQLVVKYFILRACSHSHFGLLFCLWDQLDLTSNHSNSIQSELRTAWYNEKCGNGNLWGTQFCHCCCVRIPSAAPLYMLFVMYSNGYLPVRTKHTVSNILVQHKSVMSKMKATKVWLPSPREAQI